MSEETKQKQARTRKVRGRMIREIQGHTFIFEMTAAGVIVRELYARRGFTLSFEDTLEAARGQRSLPL